MKEYADFRSFVLDVMEDENVGVREFARRLGVSHPTVSDVLAGGKPSLKTCRAIARYRHMHLSTVLKIANIMDDPSMDEGAQELVTKYSLLNSKNQEDVEDYIAMKLEKQEKEENEKSGKRKKVA